MMKFLQKLGKSLMLPVACLPAAGILMGIGYWIDPTGWGSNNIAAAFLIKAGASLINHMAILFAIGVAIGMADDQDGTSALAGLVSWLVCTTLLSSEAVAMFRHIPIEQVNPAFGKIENQFIGILCGLIGAFCYNQFKNTKLPDMLSFFSGKRCVAIMSALFSLIATLILFFAWPSVFGGLVRFGEFISNAGAVGAGLYGFFNRLLLPLGLHHALNSVFWFDVAGINDIAKFWGNADGAIRGQTGMYLAGFFPVMMFGLPAGALAMYHTAKDHKRKIAAGLLLSAALASFFTGVTEPLEFSFVFLAPTLYLAHAILTGLSVFAVTLIGPRAGFNFSAGLVDYILSFKAPMAVKPILLIPIGLVVGVVYYIVFRILITALDLKTPGREDDDSSKAESTVSLSNDNFTEVAKIILEGLGGKENLVSIDNCITRLRLEVKDMTSVNDQKIKSAGIAGIIKPGKTSIQIIVGTKVQFVADELKKLV